MGTNQDTATLEQEPAKQAGLAQQPEVPAAKRPVQVRRSQMAAARSVAMEAMNAPAPPTGTLLVGAANDPLEHEADAMAKHVVQSLRSGRADGAVAQRSTAAIPTVRRKADVGLDGGHVSADVDSQINSARGGGKPIDTAMRAMVEPHFGQDFSNVGIHTGSQASKLTESVGAQAFAIGSDVFFAEPSMANDVGLLSHELTHVVQQGGAGGVQRKMWPKEQFTKATFESKLVQRSDAQKLIESQIDKYIKKYGGGYVDDPKIMPAAISLLMEMKSAASTWIGRHVDEGIDDPKRQKRMAGMRSFEKFVDEETRLLRQRQAGSFVDVTRDIVSKSQELIQYEDKDQQASSVLENLGRIVNKAVPDNGDTTEIEVDFSFPVEPTGVGFIGGRFKVEASRDDDMVKVRTEMAVTGGAEFPWGELKAEMGGYLEAQAGTAEGAMALISYALYRRFRESAIVPRAMSNFLWGGDWGAEGKLTSDEWSLEMEKRMFSVPTPERVNFPTDEAHAAAQASRLAKLEAIRENVYVESGGLVGVSAKVDAGIFAAEVAAQGLSGNRIDMTSLENSKKGAVGAKNVKEKMAGALTGRGAEASVGRGTRGFKLSSAVAAGGFEGSSGLSVVYINDGKGGGYKLHTNELEFALKGEISLAGFGPGFHALVQELSKKAEEKIRESIARVDKDIPVEEKGTADKVKAHIGNMSSAATVLKEAKSPTVDDDMDPVKLKVSLTLDGSGESTVGAIELSRYDDKELKIPKVLNAKVARTKRIVKYTFNGGGWS